MTNESQQKRVIEFSVHNFLIITILIFGFSAFATSWNFANNVNYASEEAFAQILTANLIYLSIISFLFLIGNSFNKRKMRGK